MRWLLVSLLLLASVTPAGAASFEVVHNYADGPWLVPTFHVLGSAEDWNHAMTTWITDGRTAGKEPAPVVDWSTKAVIVLALGETRGPVGIDVTGFEAGQLDVHFALPPQWDPTGDALHPAVLVAVDRAGLDTVGLKGDAVIAGLPDTAGGTPIADGVTSARNATWGRLKALFR